LLKDVHQSLQEGNDLKSIENNFITRVKREFKDLELPVDASKLTTKQKETWKQIIRIYDHPNREIPESIFRKSIGNSYLADELLQKNIFSFHQNKDTVSYQSRPTELYVASEIGEPGSELRMKVNKLLEQETKQ